MKAADGYTYYMAEALLDTVLGKLAKKEEGEDGAAPAYEVLARFTGKELEYKEYEPLFDCAVELCRQQKKKAYYITCDGYVTLTDGTGVVHIAPAFGEESRPGLRRAQHCSAASTALSSRQGYKRPPPSA